MTNLDSTLALVRGLCAAYPHLPIPSVRHLARTDTLAVDFRGCGEQLRFDMDLVRNGGFDVAAREAIAAVARRICGTPESARKLDVDKPRLIDQIRNAVAPPSQTDKERKIEVLNKHLTANRIRIGWDPGVPFTPVHIPNDIRDLMLVDEMARRERIVKDNPMLANTRLLNAEQRARVSAEWSRQLREKVAASKRAETHQVLCDLQDEP